MKNTQSSTIEAMQDRVKEVNVANGWFDEGRTFGEGIALIHSEVSEALEAYRDHGLEDMTAPAALGFINAQDVFETYGPDEAPLPKPEGVGSEFADILVRLLDECDRQGIDLSAEFDRKLEYNGTRGFRHGGKKL